MKSVLPRAVLVLPALALGLAAVGAAPVPATPASTTDVACQVEDATITWGFKESFRSYISGAIANGQWSVSGGAEYETPTFTFSEGSGRLDARGDGGLVEFPGSITFTGHDGILNTTIGSPAVRFGGGEAILLADVTGTTQDGSEVDQRQLEFAQLDLVAAAGTERSPRSLTITDIPATLTDAGATAFGTYQAGEPFDPVTLELTFDGDCAIPAASVGWVPWALGGGVLVAGLAVGLVLFRRRPRVTPPPLE